MKALFLVAAIAGSIVVPTTEVDAGGRLVAVRDAGFGSNININVNNRRGLLGRLADRRAALRSVHASNVLDIRIDRPARFVDVQSIRAVPVRSFLDLNVGSCGSSFGVRSVCDGSRAYRDVRDDVGYRSRSSILAEAERVSAFLAELNAARTIVRDATGEYLTE